MKIVVAIAGVLDPKWPIALDEQGGPQFAADRTILGPFDESALETALRLRDLDPEANSIVAIVAGGEKIARAVAAYRIEDIGLLTLPFATASDPNSLADALFQVMPVDAGLVLMGREFGDYDDGTVPPLLAALCRLSFFGRVQDVRRTGGNVSLLREAQSEEESIALAAPLLCSVTNDRRNRLRKPLMKNVIAARNAQFGSLLAAVPQAATVERFERIADARQPVACRMAQGSPATIAGILADHLRGVAAV